MKGSVKTVFPGNNSTEGFFSYYESGLAAAERVFILKGGPGTGKSTLMRRLAEDFRDRGCDVELWRCSSDCDSLDGVFIPAYKAAVIDGTAPHIVDPRYPGVREDIVPLGECWNESALAPQREAIMALTDRISAAFGGAYGHLAAAGKIDKELRRERKEDEAALEEMDGFLREIFGGDMPLQRHFFGAAVTPEGVVDLTFDLCRDVKKRWFLRGKRGLGQQRYFEALLAHGARRGLLAEVYHGHLEPSEILGVVFPEADLAVMAAETVPGSELREGDRIIVFRGNGGAEARQKEKQRDAEVAAAVSEIARAHTLHDELENYYIAAMDFGKIHSVEKKLSQKITKKV